MSSTSASAGRLMVLEIAPEMNGCAAAIMWMWPLLAMNRSPSVPQRLAQSKTGRCSSSSPGAPSMVPVPHTSRLRTSI